MHKVRGRGSLTVSDVGRGWDGKEARTGEARDIANDSDRLDQVDQKLLL